MPSKKMYAIWKELEDGSIVFLSKNDRWITDYKEARWYAYIAHAMTKRSRYYPEAKITVATRDYAVCNHGGQKSGKKSKRIDSLPKLIIGV